MHILGHRNLRGFNALLVLESAHWAINTSHKEVFLNRVAESLSLLVSKGKLFYLHINDNFRNWDWDLIPGFVNFWDYLELLFYLREYDYQGWIALDVSPKNLNPVEVFTTSIEFMRNIEHLLKNIDSSHVFQLMKERSTPKIFSYLQNKVLNLS